MVFVSVRRFLLVGLCVYRVGALLDFSFGSPSLLHPVVQSAAYVPALSHYQTHIRHGPTFRQIGATRPDWFDPTIPAFQTTLYAPALQHAAHFGPLDSGLARSFRQDIPLVNTLLTPTVASVVGGPASEIHPAIRNALPYTPAVIHAPSVVELGHESDHLVSITGDSGVSSVISTRHLSSLIPASFYGHSYGGAALYDVRKKS
ncbi:uncharacterized protein LOC100908553 [Galendromus occidentalis]|uniref:Uncharacterized protein LOC100908553 n=1 Tax=Galendromus occidentalis TaxID=34638 RepID=A0AAJ6QSI4_9ACAR|nr:uncharacterized protein LOC100908553 [Galendromus occidentalis]